MFKKFFIVFSLFLISSNTLLASEREVVFGPEDFTVTKDAEYVSEPIQVDGFDNLIVQFDFDTTTLDKTPSLDTLIYGWTGEGVEHELGRIDGLVGSDATEIGSMTIPTEMNGEVRLYARVVANTVSDTAFLRNIMITGTKKEAEKCSLKNGNLKEFVDYFRTNHFTQSGRGEYGLIGQYVRQEAKNCLRFRSR